MNVFIINCGSSSIKFQLIKMLGENVLCSGQVEKIGSHNSLFTYKATIDNTPVSLYKELGNTNHQQALAIAVDTMVGKECGVITNADSINAVGHRVLHGGDVFSKTTYITQQVKEQVKKLFPLGPLHLPPNYEGIEIAEKLFPNAKQIAVFDTAFHQTMPPKAYRYAIEHGFYEKYGIRAYGFHGTSHKYVSEKAATFLNTRQCKLITIHLGNGCSMAAIENGICKDTSMGLGPLSGLIMGTRSGDIDPSVIFHILEQTGITWGELRDILNKKSGMLGLCGLSDMRDVKSAILKGDTNATLAYEMYAYRIKKYIGAYTAVLNGVDAIIFTGGVGENDTQIRLLCLSGMEYLGINYELITRQEENGIKSFHQEGSKVKLLVIPTNEEVEIARQCYSLVANG